MPPNITTCLVANCQKPSAARGWCRGHYDRWYTHGDVMADVALASHDISNEQRFWADVDKDGPLPTFRPDLGPCWLWSGKRDGKGYGAFTVLKRTYRAHRIAYELVVGPIPEGLELDHLCRVILCVRPDHLDPVTHLENVRRGARGQLVTHCPKGHEYTPENTYVYKETGRRCKACLREKNTIFMRDYRSRKPKQPSQHNRDKTHCVKGHPFDEANTIVTKTGRQCRICTRESARQAMVRYRARHHGSVNDIVKAVNS